MKKLITFALCALILLTGFTGCADQEPAQSPETQTPGTDPGDEITITWASMKTDNLTAEIYNRVIDAFEADNPGVQVERVVATGDTRQSFWTTLNASGNFPDIVLEAELLAATDGLFAEVPAEIQALFDPATLCQYHGKCVTIPYMKQLRMQCYYNKADFAEVGLDEPQTYQEFLDVCAALQAAGKVPLICGGTGDIWATGSPWWTGVTNQSIINQYPDFNRDVQNGAVRWDDPVIAESLQTWQDLVNAGYYHEGCMSWSYAQAATEFQNGAASMMIDGSWAAAGFDAAGSDEFGVFCMPNPDGLETYCTAVSYWGVSEQSENKEAAFQFIEYVFTHPEVYGILLQADGLSSTTVEPVTYDQGPVMSQYVENVADWTLVPEIAVVTGDYALPAGFVDEINKTLQNVFVGRDVQEELTALQSQYEMLLAQ